MKSSHKYCGASLFRDLKTIELSRRSAQRLLPLSFRGYCEAPPLKPSFHKISFIGFFCQKILLQEQGMYTMITFSRKEKLAGKMGEILKLLRNTASNLSRFCNVHLRNKSPSLSTNNIRYLMRKSLNSLDFRNYVIAMFVDRNP